jgi:regulatory protein
VDPDGTELQRALELSYRYLNRRERTIHEVRARLEAEGAETTVVDAAIEILTEHGALDDARFARLFVQDKRELEQWGAERIRQGLLGRGVDRELVAHALAGNGEAIDHDSPETELDRALNLLRRRFTAPPRDRRDRDRALGVLIRKGYDPELALDALAAYGRDPA